MTPVGFEPTIPVFERVNTFRALERATAVMAILFSRNQIPCSALTLHGVREFDKGTLSFLKIETFRCVEDLRRTIRNGISAARRRGPP
jgi:hypothetical protein